MLRYKQETALRYRRGHRDSKILDRYHQFMGTKDTIQEEDLEDEDTRAELENQLEVERKQRELFEEKFAFMQEQAQKDKTEMEENLLKMRAMIMDKASDELKEKG